MKKNRRVSALTMLNSSSKIVFLQVVKVVNTVVKLVSYTFFFLRNFIFKKTLFEKLQYYCSTHCSGSKHNVDIK